MQGTQCIVPNQWTSQVSIVHYWDSIECSDKKRYPHLRGIFNVAGTVHSVLIVGDTLISHKPL